MRSHKLVRSAVLAVASLGLAIALYVIYQYSETRSTPLAAASPTPLPALEEPSPAQTDIVQPSPTPQATSKPAESRIRIGGQSVPITGSQGQSSHEIYDETGRVQAKINYGSWEPTGEDSTEFKATNLTISFFPPNGQRIRVTGDEAIVSCKFLHSKTPDPVSGHLIGNVHILIDRLSTEQRAALSEELRESDDESRHIELVMEEIFFDREYARIETQGEFSITSAEATIKGKGLSLRYNELDSRVEELTITEGKLIELRGMGDRFAIQLPSSGNEVSEKDAMPESTAIAAKPTEKSPETSIKTDADQETVQLPVIELDERKTPTVRPTDEYKAVFAQNVQVTQFIKDKQVGHLSAEILEFIFDFGQRERELARQNPTEYDSEETEATPAKAPDFSELKDDRILLTWSGPLSVTSRRTGEFKTEQEQRVHITASGSPVRITAPQREIECERLIFENEKKTVQLFGSPDSPAHVASADMGELWGTEILLNRNEGKAFARGPEGRLLISKTTGFTGTKVIPAAKMENHDQDTEFEIRFDKEVNAVFTEVTLTPTENTDKPETRQVLKNAVFRGNVDMLRGEERIRCDRVDLYFGLNEDNKLYPTDAQAFGNVIVSQGNRFIAARDRMVVDLEMSEVDKEPFDLAKARQIAVAKGKNPDTLDWESIRRNYELKKEYRPGLSRLQAFGEVEVSDPDQELEINCESLDCVFTKGSQISSGLVTPTTGESAYIALGEFSIASPAPIPFDVAGQETHVDGPGRMTFLSEQDIDGERLDTPMLVSVQWQNRMAFDGPKNEAVFAGKVHIETEGSTYDCENLRVDFTDTPDQTQDIPALDSQRDSKWWIFEPLIAKATGKRQKNKGFDFKPAGKSFNKDPVYLYATGNVVAMYSKLDETTNRLKNRVRMSGPTMAIDLTDDYLLIDGQGNLLIEDYTKPLTNNNRADNTVQDTQLSPFGRSLGNEPSQTFIAWMKSMSYRHKINVVEFDKDVQLVHRTGAKMKLAEKLLSEEELAASSDEGREATLNCRSLVVKFERKDEDKSEGAGRMSGTEVSAFNASGNVYFFDSGISAIANQITYNREDNLLQILGSENNPAQLFDQRKRFNSLKGPRFYWDRSTNKIKAPRARGRMN